MEIISNRKENLPVDGFTDHIINICFTDFQAANASIYSDGGWNDVAGIGHGIKLNKNGRKSMILHDNPDRELCAVAIHKLVTTIHHIQ